MPAVIKSLRAGVRRHISPQYAYECRAPLRLRVKSADVRFGSFALPLVNAPRLSTSAPPQKRTQNQGIGICREGPQSEIEARPNYGNLARLSRSTTGIDPMLRREFISLIGGAATWPLAAYAQSGMRRIGVLIGLTESDPETIARLAAFRRGLERRGWSEGRNLLIDFRFAAGRADRYEPLAKELVALQPDVILAHTTPIVEAVARENRALPIVFVTVSDPIGSGFITTLARPGGNLTGVLYFEASIIGKWLAMLKEIAPRTVRAAFIANPKTTPYDYFLRSAKAVAPSLAIELVPSQVETADDIEGAIETFSRAPDGGLVLPPDATTVVYRDLIIELAARYRVPAVYTASYFVAAGGLVSYGIDQVDTFRQAASYVDRILRGDKPADLPVQAPTKYETALNLKTAKALGLTVPPGLLVAADDVVE